MANKTTVQKISSCIWFDTQAEEAAKFYTSVFKDGKIGRVSYYGKEGYEVHKMPEGTVLTVEFEIGGQSFLGLNGGPIFKPSEAISFVVNCGSQEELDYYWDKLSEGGDPASQVCGWLKDKFGVSWQVVPAVLADLMTSGDKGKAEKVMAVVMQSKKLNIQELEAAFGK
ncbi:VOC family protein [Chitinophaga agrisoli]|uniref:VOC family protein n=1 Tax=Chitinophaga agrisoli TaxID=2607653 RepID=A0A5B2VNL8_9BACT|nr:VOC family protein [Chitinophaga agrisoli]KAA2239902.1 VOC family protein [Chitinophaga agrisoli]